MIRYGCSKVHGTSSFLQSTNTSSVLDSKLPFALVKAHPEKRRLLVGCFANARSISLWQQKAMTITNLALRARSFHSNSPSRLGGLLRRCIRWLMRRLLSGLISRRCGRCSRSLRRLIGGQTRWRNSRTGGRLLSGLIGRLEVWCISRLIRRLN